MSRCAARYDTPLLLWLLVNPPRVIDEDRDEDDEADDAELLTRGRLAVMPLTCGCVVKFPP
jgi:hypothetical protein